MRQTRKEKRHIMHKKTRKRGGYLYEFSCHRVIGIILLSVGKIRFVYEMWLCVIIFLVLFLLSILK